MVNNAWIEFNNLSVQNGMCWGISINNSHNYSIRSNTITGNYTSSNPTWGAVGIYVSNSGNGYGTHEIYRNNLSSLDGGIYAQYNNGNHLLATDGLKMNCNTFLDNAGDIAMLTDNTVIPTVMKNQGVSTSYNTFVRNRYSATCLTNGDNQWYIDISNGQQSDPNYKIGHPTNVSAASPYVTVPACANPLVLLGSFSGVFDFATQCTEPGNRPQVNTNCPCLDCCRYTDICYALSDALQNTNSLQSEYTGNLDGGHTQALLNAIADANQTESSVFNHLTLHTPYLSDTVMIAYFNRNTVPATDIVQIHNGNKPVSPQVWAVLQNLPLDPARMDSINQQQIDNTISARQMAEDELGNSKSVLQSLYSDKLNYFMLDTLPGAKDTVIALLQENLGNLPNAKLMLIQAYANAGAHTRAFAYADSLGSVSGFEQAVGFEKVLLQLDTAAAAKYKIKTNSTLYTSVNTYANGDENNSSTWQARAILRSVYGNNMGLHYLNRPSNAQGRIKNPNSGTGSNPIQTQNTNVIQQNPIVIGNTKLNNHTALGIYPNPANNSVNLLYTSQSSSPVKYVINDLLGAQIAIGSLHAGVNQEIDTRNLKTGVYFVTLIQDNVVIEKQKLSISKD